MINGYKIIALCLSRVYDHDTAEFVNRLSQQADKNGFRVFVYHTRSDLMLDNPYENGEAAVFELVDFSVTDVLVIFKEKIKKQKIIDTLVRRAKENNVPVIMCSGKPEEDINIYFDYPKGFEKIVRHVIEEHGKRKIHFIAGREFSEVSIDRVNIFKKVAAENGIPDEDIRLSYGDFWSAPTRSIVEKAIAENDLPEAFICANDVMAIVTENTLKAHGYKIPDDIIVTGFDGIPEINFAAPVISSCLCDFSDLADKVADIADKAQRGESVNGSYPIIPRLLLSESCGCCTKSTFNSSEYLRRTSDRFYRYREEERHLNTISSNIQLANSPQQIFDHLNQTVIYNTCCILNEECLDPTFNPRQKRDGSPFSENMYVIFDDNYKREMVGKKIDSEIRKQKLGYQLALPYPVIFNALNFRDITLGYVCFHFTDYDIDNYVKISQVINSLDNAVNGFRNMRYQQYINTQMEQMYKFDMMTGLYNRNGCIKEFEHVKAHAEDVGEPVSFLLADLDGLKKINDGYGHCEGDNAISTAARAIRSALPKSAIGARIGGDEMIAFWCGKADREKICGDVEEYLDCYNKVSGKPYKVGVSIGIYVSDNEGLEFDSFIKKADEPMYENKAKRRI